jgi:hypothetical protein
VRLLAIESLVRDRRDGRAALAALSRLSAAPTDQRLRLRVGFLRADAYVAAGRPDSARAVLQALATDFPQMRARIEERARTINAQ